MCMLVCAWNLHWCVHNWSKHSGEPWPVGATGRRVRMQVGKIRDGTPSRVRSARRRPFGIALIAASGLLREGLARILLAANFQIVASASCFADLVLSPSSERTPTVLVIHAGDQPGSTVEQIRAFKEHHAGGPVVVVGDRIEASEIVSAFRAGANAYFGNTCSCDALIKSLELLMLDEAVIIPWALLPLILGHVETHEDGIEVDSATSHATRTEALPQVETGHMPRLSLRQQTILRCLASGDSNKVIARKVDIAEATVKVHVKAILRKIRVHNRTQAAIWAMSNSQFASAFDDSALPYAKPSDQQSSIRAVPKEPLAAERNAPSLSPIAEHFAEGVELISAGRPSRKGVRRKSD
jgi:two-component system, NarL family, nitrate/nitrite response regulator NarL